MMAEYLIHTKKNYVLSILCFSISVRELCIIHRCEPETICGEWVAYSKNRNITIKVTTEHLDQMEREVIICG